MPAPEHRADEAGHPASGAAPEAAANNVSPHGHQAAADYDDCVQKSDDLPD